MNRSFMLYQTGQQSQAIRELEDEEVALRGRAEVHAALAVMLYKSRPDQRQRAEEQWELASEFDKRFADVAWVAKEKSWPPALLGALDEFLHLG